VMPRGLSFEKEVAGASGGGFARLILCIGASPWVAPKYLKGSAYNWKRPACVRWPFTSGVFGEMRIACATSVCLLLAAPLSAAEVKGIPEIVDADTIYVGTQKIRLSGIDAPETDQICLDSRGQNSSCGVDARSRLQEHAGSRPWICQLSGIDRHGRNLGTCSVNGEDVSRWLVHNGWALAFRRYSTAYVADEDYAREHRSGLWGGAFIAPWDWRLRGAKTTILGALDVPADAQRKLMSPRIAGEPSAPGCVIKGNMNRRDECIYHVPGGRFYGRLQMEPARLRRWFCSEAEAEAAGCRKSKL
jgi:endonuclease YncB( thermonuclease family)